MNLEPIYIIFYCFTFVWSWARLLRRTYPSHLLLLSPAKCRIQAWQANLQPTDPVGTPADLQSQSDQCKRCLNVLKLFFAQWNWMNKNQVRFEAHFFWSPKLHGLHCCGCLTELFEASSNFPLQSTIAIATVQVKSHDPNISKPLKLGYGIDGIKGHVWDNHIATHLQTLFGSWVHFGLEPIFHWGMFWLGHPRLPRELLELLVVHQGLHVFLLACKGDGTTLQIGGYIILPVGLTKSWNHGLWSGWRHVHERPCHGKLRNM